MKTTSRHEQVYPDVGKLTKTERGSFSSYLYPNITHKWSECVVLNTRSSERTRLQV